MLRTFSLRTTCSLYVRGVVDYLLQMLNLVMQIPSFVRIELDPIARASLLLSKHEMCVVGKSR